MKRLGIYFSDEDIEYIDKVKKENNCSSRNKAISLIISEHKNKNYNEVKNIPEYIAGIIIKELKGEFDSIKKLKTSTKYLDKDIQILLELMNGIYYNEDYDFIPSIEDGATRAYKDSIERVDTKIAKEFYKKNKSLD